MHEMGIAAEIIETARAALAGRPGFRARRLTLSIGCFQPVDRESLSFAFGILAEDDPVFRGAQIEVEDAPLTFHCASCGSEGHLKSPCDPCPACGSSDLRVSGGDEIVLRSVEGEDAGWSRRGRGSESR